MHEYNSGSHWNSSLKSESETVTISLLLKEETTDINKDNEIAELHDNCDTNTNKNLTKTSREQQLEYLLSNLLKYGVLLASAVVLLGGILYLIHHGNEPVDYHVFHGTASTFCSPAGVLSAVLSGSRRGIIQLGLLLLIATPILRVVISLLAFLLKREFIYVIVTSLVLASLTYSLIGAYY